MDGWLLLSSDLFVVHLIVVGVYGALMGSFFNVCIYRLPLGRSVNQPQRSFCPSCGTTIAWYDNIPLFSYVNLGGLCRHCGSRIRSRYFWVELLTAALFAGVFWVHGYSAATLLFLILTGILIISTFTDLDHWIIPDWVSVGGTVLGVAAALAISAVGAIGHKAQVGRSLYPYLAFPFDGMGPWGIAANAAVGAVFGFAMLWGVGALGTLMFRKEAMGMGDMKLFACIGAFMGWQASIAVLAVASFVGATLGLSLILAQWIVEKGRSLQAGGDEASGSCAQSRPRRKLHHLPFGPYIAIAGYVVALFYEPMMDWLVRHVLLVDLFGGM